jgi:two-component system, NtrC family, sensor histidine kinase PilS
MTSDSRRRLVWLIGSRVVVSTLLLGSAAVFQVSAPGSLAVDPFFFLIGLTYGLSIIYAATLRFIDRSPWLVSLQFSVDVIAVTAFIHFTGGVTSYFQLLYVLPIVGAAAVQMRRGARRVALVSALLYSALVLHQYTGGAGYIGGEWIPEVRPFLPPIRVASYTVAANAIAFVAVALLSGSLAERLQRADDRLAVASTALADLQAFNQHVIESLTSGLITTDRAGRVVSLNRAAEQIMALPAHRAVGHRAAEILQVPSEFAALLDAELGGAESQRADYSYRTADGGRREIGLSAAHLVTPDGPAGYLLTFQDVTEIRRLEHEARRRQRLAAVGEMAAGIAHEIRNPLASMRGSIQVLRAELSLTDEQASLMDIVLRESDRLNETIRSFLAYARPQAAVPNAVDLMRVLTDAATLLRNSPELKPGHQVVVEGPGEGLIVDADEHQIRQVVWNLATNGLRAMPDGGTLRLVVRPSSDADGHVGLAVVDQGVGIPAEQLDTLFQPFHGSFGQGSGLGLAIVHRIVQDHRGEVVVESEVGRGTQVTVRLPSTRGVQAEAVRAD